MSNPPSPDYPALLRRSLVAIEQLESKLAAAETEQSEPIAILGMACRFPGDADTPAAFWKLLFAGRDAVTEVPPTRWDVDAVFDPDPDIDGEDLHAGGAASSAGWTASTLRSSASRRGRPASLDPQQRLLLEVTWEALEHAGIAPSSIAGSNTGGVRRHVDATTMRPSSRRRSVWRAATRTRRRAARTASRRGACRISSVFTARTSPSTPRAPPRSSRYMARLQSLRRREATLALAGGVNLTLTPVGAILTSRARMMSFDGRCKTFDASADGYVRAEGCGMLVLKRLTDAQRDGDRVLAVIRGSALNQDGRSSGLTAPNGAAQEAVIREALANARLSPSDISVVEAHGTGTSLGDPIEVNALGRVFGQPRSRQRPLHRRLGKDEHRPRGSRLRGCRRNQDRACASAPGDTAAPAPAQPESADPVEQSLPIRVPDQASTPWEASDGVPRRAGVSSFGFSGTNAHMVLEEPPASALTPAQSDLPAAAARALGPDACGLARSRWPVSGLPAATRRRLDGCRLHGGPRSFAPAGTPGSRCARRC